MLCCSGFYKISGVAVKRCWAKLKKSTRNTKTSEYAFLLEELPSLQAKHPDQDLAQIYNEAIHAYRKARLDSLKLYPGVMGNSPNAERKRVSCSCVTESMEF